MKEEDFIFCPTCNIPIDKETHTCPRCKLVIRSE